MRLGIGLWLVWIWLLAALPARIASAATAVPASVWWASGLVGWAAPQVEEEEEEEEIPNPPPKPTAPAATPRPQATTPPVTPPGTAPMDAPAPAPAPTPIPGPAGPAPNAAPLQPAMPVNPAQVPANSPVLANQAETAPLPTPDDVVPLFDPKELYDLVVFSNGETFQASLFSEPLQWDAATPQMIKLVAFNPDVWTIAADSLSRTETTKTVGTFASNSIKQIDYLEKRILRTVQNWSFDWNKKTLRQQIQTLAAAHARLQQLYQFEQAALANGIRGSRFQPFLVEIGDRLRAVRLELATKLRAVNEMDLAHRWMLAVQELDPTHPDVLRHLDTYFQKQAEEFQAQQNLVALRELLDKWQQNVPNSTNAQQIVTKLQQQAAELLSGVQNTLMALDPAVTPSASTRAQLRDQAQLQLQAAWERWPTLPGLREAAKELKWQYPRLRIGCAQLPTRLWPGMEQTDADWLAQSLLYRKLMHCQYDELRGWVAQPELIRALPAPIYMGRRLTIEPGWRWADGSTITANDVQFSLEYYQRQVQAPNYYWPRLWADCRIVAPLVVDLHFTHHYWSPLHLGQFYLLPSSARTAVRSAQDNAPQLQAVPPPPASGPMQWGQQAVNQTIFYANPNSTQRLRQPFEHPLIQEVVFQQIPLDAPAFLLRELNGGHLDVLYDVRREIQAQIAVPGMQYYTTDQRHLEFVAINHRTLSLQDRDLRLALLYGIPRQQILEQEARFTKAECDRLACRGPFPADSWIYEWERNRLPADLYQPELAKAHWGNYLRRKLQLAPLRFVYPQEDPLVGQFCTKVAAALQTIGISCDLLARSRADWHQSVRIDHAYDLAWAEFRYYDDTWQLWPLLDSQATGPGQANYLGYRNDKLTALFESSYRQRELTEQQRRYWQIHWHCLQEVPFVPLWFRPRTVALQPWVKLPNASPARSGTGLANHREPIFADFENWQLQPQPEQTVPVLPRHHAKQVIRPSNKDHMVQSLFGLGR